MSSITTTAGEQIEEHHRQAQTRAAEAVQHAREAGLILLMVKAEVGHGGFLSWLQQHVTFTARTAQRYMGAAAPAPKATTCRISVNKPKAGSKAARMRAALDRAAHRDDVLAHAAYLAGTELPDAATLDHDQIALLANLRDRLNTVLGGVHG